MHGSSEALLRLSFFAVMSFDLASVVIGSYTSVDHMLGGVMISTTISAGARIAVFSSASLIGNMYL